MPRQNTGTSQNSQSQPQSTPDQAAKDRALAEKVAEQVMRLWREELRLEQERRGKLGKGF